MSTSSSSDFKMTTITMLVSLVISCAVLGTATFKESADWPSEGEYASKEELKALEISRQLEIERQKALILRTLGKTEPPVFANASLHPLPKHVLQMLTDYESSQPPAKPQENIAQVVILPKNSEFLCHWNGSSSCRRFEFEVPTDVLRSPSELSVCRLFNRSEKATVSVFYSQPEHEKEKMAERKESVVDVSEDQWLSFQLQTFEKVKFWTENVTFAVEITGLPVDDAEPNLPFLKMKKDMEARSRQRRSELPDTRDRGCHRVPLKITFAQIGYGDWIVHPPFYEANMCKGYCTHSKNPHETFMGHLFDGNVTLKAAYGECWGTCCRPKSYDTLSLIYRETNSTYVQSNMTDMIIKDCSCS